MQVGVVKSPSCTITAGLREISGEIGKSNTWIYQRGADSGDGGAATFVSWNAIPVSLLQNCAMWSLKLIVIRNSPHRTVVTHIVAAVHKWKGFDRAAVR